MITAMQAAGYYGITDEGGVIYARTNPALPEFTAVADGGHWRLEILWPLRATEMQLAGWNDLYPETPLDTDLGETRMQMRASPDDLTLWAARVDLMVAKCTVWRRATRQRDEGM
jgi:hypothetical protein